jgi:hypothetical protein
MSMYVTNEADPGKRTSPLLWRRVFICALTTQITLSVIFITNAGYLNEDSAWVRCAVIHCTELAATLTLIGYTPSIFRRRGLAGAIVWLYFLLLTSYIFICPKM